MACVMRAGFVIYLIGNLIKCSYSQQIWVVDRHYRPLCESSLKCKHNWVEVCGADKAFLWLPVWFKDTCTLLEYNCQHLTRSLYDKHTTWKFSVIPTRAAQKTSFETESSEEANMASMKTISVILIIFYFSFVASHGPPADRDTEDISMGRKVKKTSGKWCSMAKVCNHDRVPVCGLSHAGDIMGFRDLCDMFDFNCIRRRNYKQTNCPADKNFLTASRKPTNTYYDD